jgi:hypothetical protein
VHEPVPIAYGPLSDGHRADPGAALDALRVLLASDAVSSVTGTTVPVDGGRVLG